MHEMSLAQSLLDIVRQEMQAHALTQLKEVKVTCGRLSGVVPEAMHTAFTALIRQTDLDGASLELELIPLQLCCAHCQTIFSPQDESSLAVLAAFAPCPTCHQEIGHQVLAGKELNIEYIEGE